MASTNCKICGHPFAKHDHSIQAKKIHGGVWCNDCQAVCK